MNLLRKIVDFFLTTYLFIASASLCLVLATYILMGQKLQLTPVSVFAFFSTLLIYNFHKVSTLLVRISFSPQVILNQFEMISILTKIMIAVSVVGIVVSTLFLQVKTILFFIPVAVITLAYSVPVLKIKGTKRRLREIVIVKVTTLAFIWGLTTAILPMIDSGLTIFSESSVLIFTERFLFMFAICIPFEIRDITQEKIRGNITLPQVIGIPASKILGLGMLFVFILLTYFQFRNSMQQSIIPALYLSAFVAAVLLLFSGEKRSTYYFRVFIDGTMQLQFLLLILFRNFL